MSARGTKQAISVHFKPRSHHASPRTSSPGTILRFNNRTGAVGYYPPRPLPGVLPTAQSWIIEMRVAQLPKAPRVPPHWNSGGVKYWARVHVCAMYSDASQIVLPSAEAAP